MGCQESLSCMACLKLTKISHNIFWGKEMAWGKFSLAGGSHNKLSLKPSNKNFHVGASRGKGKAIFEENYPSEWKFSLVDVSNIFYFFLLGGGEGGVRGAGRGGGGDFLLKIPGGGVSRAGGGRGARGRESVCGELGGGGLNIFFRGRNSHQVSLWGKIHPIFPWKILPQKMLKLTQVA